MGFIIRHTAIVPATPHKILEA